MLTDFCLLFMRLFGVLNKSSEKQMSRMASMMKHVQLHFGWKVMIFYCDNQCDCYDGMNSLHRYVMVGRFPFRYDDFYGMCQ